MMQQIEDLRRSVENLGHEALAIRRALDKRTWLLGMLFAGGAIILACALLAAYTVSLNNQRSIAENNRKWCPMVGLLILKPGDPRPPTERGKRIADSAYELYKSFGCEK